jgi:hypothetical protein
MHPVQSEWPAMQGRLQIVYCCGRGLAQFLVDVPQLPFNERLRLIADCVRDGLGLLEFLESEPFDMARERSFQICKKYADIRLAPPFNPADEFFVSCPLGKNRIQGLFPVSLSFGKCFSALLFILRSERNVRMTECP